MINKNILWGVLVTLFVVVGARAFWAFEQAKKHGVPTDLKPVSYETNQPPIIKTPQQISVVVPAEIPPTQTEDIAKVPAVPVVPKPTTPSVVPTQPSTPPSSPSASKNSAFVLVNMSTPDITSLLANAQVDGVAMQLVWSQFEKENNVYTWALIDNNIDIARAKGKKVTIHVFASLNAPSWLAAAGVKYYSYQDFQGKAHTDPIPWDSVYLSNYTDFLKALADHLKEKNYTDSVSNISVATPVGEMSLISCRNGVLATGINYDRALYLSAWKQMIDAHATYFPSINKFVSAPVGVICMPDNDTSFYREVMDYATSKYGKTFWVFAADLNAEGSSRTKNYLDYMSKTSLAYQTIWSSTNDGKGRMKGTYPSNLKQAICKGLSNGASYFEIYAVDVANKDSSIQSAISIVHTPSLCAQ